MMKIFLTGLILLLSACSTVQKTNDNKGAYYQDDGPHAQIDIQLDDIKDATPKIEAINNNTKKPYKVFGEKYVPMTKIIPYKEKGYASWYGKKYHGNKTSIGETYNMYEMSGAHKTLPLPSYLRVRNLKNNKQVIIRLNDRGPFLKNRVVDLSYAAAYKLDIIEKGSEYVEIELIDPEKNNPASVNQLSFLQVGAFKDYLNGQVLLNKINTLDFSSEFDSKIIKINDLFHVLIGPVVDNTALLKIKEKLESEYSLSVYVKKY
ncbi:MAG: septal ring lytic transglycosylase RlpA family protein [Proteobacteria bacterium]|jgi:rare lipoprotein A|nr:septal ring lytic transglycosylase RlpA family protein [Pseudomonadota bacterium]